MGVLKVQSLFTVAQGLGHRKGTSVNMIWHNGSILKTAVTANIFWGSSWGTSAGDKISGLDLFYLGFNGSGYSMTSDEYSGSNGQVGALTTHLGYLVDTSAATGGNFTSPILAEVCKMITSPDPSGNGYYSVHTDLPRGNAGYCAWHSYGTCNGTPVQFAFFLEAGRRPRLRSSVYGQRGIAGAGSTCQRKRARTF
jgi:hypothetical protein